MYLAHPAYSLHLSISKINNDQEAYPFDAMLASLGFLSWNKKKVTQAVQASCLQFQRYKMIAKSIVSGDRYRYYSPYQE